MTDELLNKGRKALSTGEWEKSNALLLEALKENPSAEVYEELAWSFWWLNNISAVFENRSKAYELYLEKDDILGAGRTACWIGLDYIDFKGEFAVASGWFKRAENLLKDLSDYWEIGFIKILKARWAFEVEKNTDLAIKLIDETLELSKRLNNVDGEMLAEALKGFILVMEGKISEGMPLLDEATLLALTSKHGDIKITTITCCYLIDACERIRDYERASQWCKNVKEICSRWRYKAMFTSCRIKYAGVLIWKGNWKDAEEELLIASNELKELRPKQVNASTVRLADLNRRKGNWEEAEKLLGKIESHPLKTLYSAYLYFDKEEYEKAENMAERYLRKIPEKEKAQRTTGVEILLNIYIHSGKLNKAKKLLKELEEIYNTIKTPPIKAALLNAKGKYNLVIEDYDQARKDIEDALDIYEKIKSPFESARTGITLSEILINLNKFKQAETELNKVINIFKNLGAEKDYTKAKYILKNLYKNNSTIDDKIKHAFTGRELEVLRLIAEGKKNDEIADKLFLSTRTIEKHITNIYAKMGISGKSARAYVASYAIKNNLV